MNWSMYISMKFKAKALYKELEEKKKELLHAKTELSGLRSELSSVKSELSSVKSELDNAKSATLSSQTETFSGSGKRRTRKALPLTNNNKRVVQQRLSDVGIIGA